MTKRSLAILSVMLFMVSSNAQEPWLKKVSPEYLLCNYSGMAFSHASFKDNPSYGGLGIYSIGIPIVTMCVDIKNKVYAGALAGVELGAAFPKGDVGLLAKIRLGLSLGYRFNDDAYLCFNHYLLSQAGVLQQTSADDGWVFAGTARYKHLMLDVSKNMGALCREDFSKGG